MKIKPIKIQDHNGSFLKEKKETLIELHKLYLEVKLPLDVLKKNLEKLVSEEDVEDKYNPKLGSTLTLYRACKEDWFIILDSYIIYNYNLNRLNNWGESKIRIKANGKEVNLKKAIEILKDELIEFAQAVRDTFFSGV